MDASRQVRLGVGFAAVCVVFVWGALKHGCRLRSI